MNGYQRIMAALQGRQPDGVPIMLHNFMPAAREAGYSMRTYRGSAAAIADTFIRAVERYKYDGIVVDVDTATLAEAVGVPVDFPEDEPARCRTGCLSDLREVSDLPPPDIGANPRVQIWAEAVQRLSLHFGDEILVRGNADQAPFSLASMMRTPANWMMDLMDEQNRPCVFQLLEHCTEATCQFVRLMARAGAHVTSNGDSPAGPEMISPEMYATFALPYEQRVAAAAHECGLPYILHICGNTEPILPDMMRAGAEGLELDYKTDVRAVRKMLEGRATFIGNIDPSGVLARGSVVEVKERTEALLALFAHHPRFILNAGCALPASTPGENVRAMIDTARRHGGA